MRKLSIVDQLRPYCNGLEMNAADRKGKARVRINISGAIYETFYSTLERYPFTLLGNNRLRACYYDEKRDEYFFNRNREAFDSILFFYQSPGKLLKPSTITLRDFLDELEFFQMGEELLERFKAEIHYSNSPPANLHYKGPGCLRRLWNFLEHPKSSMGAMMMTLFAVSVIVYSIVCFCLETLPTWRRSASHRRALDISEILCVAWFTLELILRAIAAPDKKEFAKTLLNIMDAVSIAPFYVTQFMKFFKPDDAEFNVLTAMRLVRVLRIFKLARHLRILNILFNTIRSSAAQLMLLVFFTIIGTILYASAIFYAENSFGSIPAAFWWSIITLTNVGYGDLVPVSYAGKLVGSLCAISGVVALALPIPVIVSSFMFFNNLDKEMALNDGKSELEEGAKKKMEIMRSIFGLGKHKATFASATKAR